MRSQIKQYVIECFPRLYVLADKAVSIRKYWNERSLVLSGSSRRLSRGRGLVFFSYYRCGSQFAKRAIDSVISSQGDVWKRLDIEGYLFHFEPEAGNLYARFDSLSHCFDFEDCVYGPIYHPVKELLNHSEHRKLCILRDPRDVLVSHYYSTAFAHTVTSEAGAKRREEVAALSVDEFACRDTLQEEILERYQILLEAFDGWEDSSDRVFIRYEDLMTDFSGQIRRLASLMKFDVSESWLCENASEVQLNLDSDKEDVRVHHRSGKSGQFRDKLRDETVERLNVKFAEILGPWGEC